MPTALSYLYTTKAECLRRYGDVGLKSIVQDLGASDTVEFWTELTSEATDVINTYCLVFYNAADLYNSRWVRSRATWIGCYLLSQRRGNPAQFIPRYQEIMEELLMVMEGRLMIPGLATSNDFAPAMSNLQVDDRFAVSKIRVEQIISTGGTSSRQNLSNRWGWDFL